MSKLRYRFYCNDCKKEVKRKEVMPVITRCSITPKGSPREEIVRAFHFPNCVGRGELDIVALEGKEIQTKFLEGF